MANNNIRYVQAGIESLSDTILERFHKGTTCIDNLKFLKNCVEYNIRVLWNILSGSPGETHEDYKDQLKLIPKIVHFPPPAEFGLSAIKETQNIT